MNTNFPKKFMLMMTLFFTLIIGFIVFKNITVSSILKNIRPEAASVKIITLEHKRWPLILQQPGTIKAKQNVRVSCLVAGHVQEIYVNPGQFVKKDQILIKLNSALYEAAEQKAYASYQLAELNLARDQQLFNEETISSSVYNTTVATFNQAKADLEQASIQVDHHMIRAPFDAIVDYFDLNLGDYIQIGQPLIQLYTLQPHDIEFSLPQEYINQIKDNHAVNVMLNDQSYEGIISSRGQGVSPQSRHFLIKASLPQIDIITPGQYANVSILFDDKTQHYVIPQSTLNYTTLGSVVWEVKRDTPTSSTGTAYPIEVSTYRANDKMIAIKGAGLKTNMTLVALGQTNLTSGSKVVIHE
ncbi:efflux RND transporter periplasmic adaptor subunit [bacterium]|nr:efflux RND transporter periplasmic adaptor subunit [bacterium]NBW57044.1 efflux RND transporter periplasmic adaptor subunit [bacterium]NBX72506.1 efflux RND transporter periplasmic adaptor subunit [bacterium]